MFRLILVEDESLVHLPGMSGVEVLKALSARVLAVPVTLITTFDEEQSFLQSRRGGASAFLRKENHSKI